jgi:hypothetical protein
VTAYNTAQATNPGADCLSMFAGNRTDDSVFYNGTGTITTSTANATVTGTGSSFFVQFAPGFKIYNQAGTSIGTVSSVTSNTSMTLAANSSITLSTQPYLFSNQGSYCVSYGGEDDAGTSNVFTRISSNLVTNVNGATPSNIVVADMTNFDTRPGFNLNYTTSNASARLGWILAVKNFDANRRRGRTG